MDRKSSQHQRASPCRDTGDEIVSRVEEKRVGSEASSYSGSRGRHGRSVVMTAAGQIQSSAVRAPLGSKLKKLDSHTPESWITRKLGRGKSKITYLWRGPVPPRASKHDGLLAMRLARDGGGCSRVDCLRMDGRRHKREARGCAQWERRKRDRLLVVGEHEE